MKVQKDKEIMAHGPSRALLRGPGSSTSQELDLDSKLPGKNFIFKSFYSKCLNSRCKTCIFADNNQIKENMPIFCKASNCIYLITCFECNLKYVGQTGNALNLRINGHRSDIKNFKCKEDIELKHFQKHSFCKIIINILEICNDYKDRIVLENYHITRCKSLYPFGLNNIFNGSTIVKNINETCIYSLFTSSGVHIRGRRGGRRNRPDNDTRIKVFIKSIKEFKNEMLSQDIIRKIKTLIFGTKNKTLAKALRDGLLSEKEFCIPEIWYIIIDFCKFKLRVNNLDVILNKNDPKINYLVLTFQDRIFDFINISTLIKDFEHLLPFENDKVIIRLAFKYKKTIGRMVCNYNDLSRNCPDGSYDDLCMCSLFTDFIDDDLGHVVTGNLDIVEDSKLRNFMNRGTNFRPSFIPRFKFIVDNFVKELNLFCLKASYIFNYPYEGFNEWKYSIIASFKDKLNYALKYKYNSEHIDFYDDKIKKAIIKLQELFAVTVVDKAGNNFAIMCKKLYFDLLNKEYCLNDTFTMYSNSIDVFKKKILAFYKLLKIKPDNFDFPYLFITVKFHKTPIGFRFVTSGTKSYNKKASEALQTYLKIITDHLISQGDNFIILNSQRVINYIDNFSRINTIDTYDFENLFTSLPHNNMLDVFNSLFEEFRDLLNCSRDFWNSLISFCIFNNILFNGKDYHIQTKGIPMGSNYSSNFANLYLHYFENKAHNNHKIQALRYIDDVIVFNGNNFENVVKDIYPAELKLKRTNLHNNQVNFLDLNIDITTDYTHISLYDKRKEFKFEVRSLTNWYSNVSIKVHRNIVISYLCRIKRICNCKIDFLKEVDILIEKLIGNGFPKGFIFSCLGNFEAMASSYTL